MTELVFTNLFLPTLAAFGIGIVGALLCLAAFRPTRSMLLTCAFCRRSSVRACLPSTAQSARPSRSSASLAWSASALCRPKERT
ncbi:hypothetical protein [Allobaculum sp. Allo2]|uniref:hypothetical protein n=1 Tax=Allobaculum sp. Allo2 TaxID=2853432 RepID=UPI001F6001C4|nr:hypothetical protein [Allobaculum sp. Allo2]